MKQTQGSLMKYSWMKLGFVALMVACGFTPMVDVVQTFANGSAPLLQAGSTTYAQLAVMITLVAVAGIRILMEGKVHRPGYDAFPNWIMLMWVFPMIAAEGAYFLLCWSFGLTMDLPTSGEPMRTLAVLGLFIVMVSAVLEATVTFIIRGMHWALNRTSAKA